MGGVLIHNKSTNKKKIWVSWTKSTPFQSRPPTESEGIANTEGKGKYRELKRSWQAINVMYKTEEIIWKQRPEYDGSKKKIKHNHLP